MTPRTVLVALIASAVVAGCGGSSSSSDEDQIKQTTKDLVSAMKSEDWSGACDTMSKAAQDQLKEVGAQINAKDCADTLKKAAAAGANKDLDKLETSITDIKITGNKATAKNGSDSANFVKEGGEWKVDIDS
jgi:hypothetical protein